MQWFYSRQSALLTKPWNISDYHTETDDFNPNRIVTATWKRNNTGSGGTWYWADGHIIGQTTQTPTTFTLGDERTLTAGQTYYWAVQAISPNQQPALERIDYGQFRTLPPTVTTPFSSVTVVTHGFENQLEVQPVIFARAAAIASAGAEDPNHPGVVMRYNGNTGEWQAVDEWGRVRVGVTADDAFGKPLVLVVDWAKYGESIIPDSGFSEAAADAVIADIANLNQQLNNKIFESPMHFIGHSRGTIVTSEMIQRLGTYFSNEVGKNAQRDLQVTYLDVHDFEQQLP